MGSVVISGTGSYLPDVIVTNDDIESMSTDFDPVRARMSLGEWARRYTGSETRHYVRPGESTSDMATVAAQRALADAQVEARAIDLLVLATTSSDHRVPQTAGIVQANLGMGGKFLQIDAGCTGFVDGLMIASSLMEKGLYDHALVVGSEVMSFVLDSQDFKQMVTFGDGAGAAVLRRVPEEGYGLRSFCCGSDGGMGYTICIPSGGSRNPITPEAIARRQHLLHFNFAPIYNYAVERMTYCTQEVVKRAGITLDDVDWVIPHQASTNIIQDAACRLEMPPEKFRIIFDQTGNTSSAAIPMALDDANRQGKFTHGDWMVMPSVGIGMAWGAACMRWYDYKAARSTIDGPSSLYRGGVQ